MRALLFAVLISVCGWAQAQRPAELFEKARVEFEDELSDAYWRIPDTLKNCPDARSVVWAHHLADEYLAAHDVFKRRELMQILLIDEKIEYGKIRRVTGRDLDLAYCRYVKTIFEDLHKKRGIRLIDWK